MNAYLFSAICSMSQLRPSASGPAAGDIFQTWDGCSTAILLAENPEAAQRSFEEGLHRQPEGESPVDVDVRKIAAAQLMDQLLTEAGSRPFDWQALIEQHQTQLETIPLDEFEHGYWVDVDAAVPPRQLSADIETLQRDLPEDIRSGLNWSPDKQFLYVLSVFSRVSPPPAPVEIMEEDSPEQDSSDANELQLLEAFPQGADKDAAAVIQARNSVVAAWLWRRFAADSILAINRIRIDPWCGVACVEN